MQQRRPRLGDVLDDYCPRERRITNHVIVAMIEDDVRQTRCTTCNADHEYKQAKTPPPRRTKAAAASLEAAESLAALKPALASPTREPSPVESIDEAPEQPATSLEPAPFVEVPVAAAAAGAADQADQADTADTEVAEADLDRDEGPVHRRLIRATLPRPEGQVPERREPEFTIRQSGRGREMDGNGAGPRHKGQRSAGGYGNWGGGGGGQSRFGGQRQGSGRGGPQGGQRSGRPAGGDDNRAGGQRQGPGPGRRRGR